MSFTKVGLTMKIIKNKTHYSLNRISKMFGLAGTNTSLKNFLIENVPYVCIDGKQFFDKEIIDDLYSNHSKYGLKSTKIENCYFFYKEGSIADDYISNYFTISQLKQKYMELQGQELMVYTFEKLGININQYPIEQVSLAGRTYNFIPNMYLDEMLNKIIIKQKLDATNNPYEKYEIRTSFIPELQQYKFKKTLQYVKEYLYFALSKNKKQKIITHNILEIQDFLINNLDKEIHKYSNDEIFEVILKMDCSGSVKNTFFRFLNFLSQKPDVLFDTEFGIKSEPRVKQNDDFYTIDEWERYINYIFDIDKHIEKAFSNYKYARYWLFLMLQCNLAWRLSDILAIPPLPFVDIEKYNMKWFEENEFTLEVAQIIVETAKDHIEQYLVQKTGVRKHFIIANSFMIGVAIGFIICEQFRRSINANDLFNNIEINYSKLVLAMDKDIDGFSNLKACRSLLSFANEVGTQTLQGNAISIASYMRSHRIDTYSFSNTTTIYLKTTYDEKELLSLPAQMNELGIFGWFYNDILKILDIKPNDKTKMIAGIQKELSPQKIDSLANMILYEQKKRDDILDEVLHMEDTSLQQYLFNISIGRHSGKQEGFQCMKENCPYPTNDECVNCIYSIPTIHCVGVIGQASNNILDELLQDNGNLTNLDIKRLSYQLYKLLSLLKEAKLSFGDNFVETIANYDVIKEKFNEYKELHKK